jgi:hypothetical protein
MSWFTFEIKTPFGWLDVSVCYENMLGDVTIHKVVPAYFSCGTLGTTDIKSWLFDDLDNFEEALKKEVLKRENDEFKNEGTPWEKGPAA